MRRSRAGIWWFSVCSLIDFWLFFSRVCNKMTKVAKNVLQVTSTLIYLQSFDETGSSESLVRPHFFSKKKTSWIIFSHRQITQEQKSGCLQPRRRITRNWRNLPRNILNWSNYRWVVQKIIKLGILWEIHLNYGFLCRLEILILHRSPRRKTAQKLSHKNLT